MQAVAREGVRVKGWQGLAAVDAQGRTAFVAGQADLTPHTALIADILRRPASNWSTCTAPPKARCTLACSHPSAPAHKARWVWPT